MAKEEEYDKLPDKGAAKEFYAKYEPKEILGRQLSIINHFINVNLIQLIIFLGGYLQQLEDVLRKKLVKNMLRKLQI